MSIFGKLHLALEHSNDLLICVTVRLDMTPLRSRYQACTRPHSAQLSVKLGLNSGGATRSTNESYPRMLSHYALQPHAVEELSPLGGRGGPGVGGGAHDGPASPFYSYTISTAEIFFASKSRRGFGRP